MYYPMKNQIAVGRNIEDGSSPGDRYGVRKELAVLEPGATKEPYLSDPGRSCIHIRCFFFLETLGKAGEAISPARRL